MKLRIRRDSIRLRLTISEVERLAAGGTVSATLDTAPVKFAIEVKPEPAERIEVNFDLGRLAVSIPIADAKELAYTDRVGIRSSGATQVVIEKDFGCARPRKGEDVSDLYGYAAMVQ